MILTTMPATNVRTARRGDGGLHPGTASQLTLVVGSGQTAVAGTNVPTAPAVLVRDQLEQPIAGFPIQFVVVGGSTASEVTVDTFVRANENPLAGTWSKVGGAATNLQLLTNSVRGATLNGEGLMYSTAATWPPDQYSECQLLVGDPGGGGPAVRMLAGADSVYMAQAVVGQVTLFKVVAGTYSILQQVATALSSTDTLRLEARGSTLRMYKNGVQLGTDVIDGSLTTGAPGLDIFSNTTFTVTRWAAGLPPSTSGTVNPDTTVLTNAAGVAAATGWTLGTVPGVNTLTVRSPGLAGSAVTVTATGVTSGAQATQIASNAGNNQTAQVGTALPVAPSVIVRDAANQPVAGVLVTFAIASGAGTLIGANQTTNASGIATVGSWTLGSAVGTNTLTATSAGLNGSPVTFTATGTGVLNELLFEELFTGTTQAYYEGRGWYDGTAYITAGAGDGYKFLTDATLGRNVLYAHWATITPTFGDPKEPAIGIRLPLTTTSLGATAYLLFKTHNMMGASTGCHWTRFGRGWGTFTPTNSAGQIDMDLVAQGPQNLLHDPATGLVINDTSGVFRTFYLAIGDSTTWANPSGGGLLTDDTWYEMAYYVKPSSGSGTGDGIVRVVVRSYGGVTWTTVFVGTNVATALGTGTINQFVIALYGGTTGAGVRWTNDIRTYFGTVRIFAGDAVTSGQALPIAFDFYVSPTGGTGAGTIGDPWSLTYALGGAGGAITPGKIIALRGGTYTGAFTSTITGTVANPVVVRQYTGERATISGSLTCLGSDTWFWGFEVTRPNPGDGTQVNGVQGRCPRGKYINLIIHDASGSGLTLFDQGVGNIDCPDQEAYGCIIYNNGHLNNNDHGIYVDNITNAKTVRHNVIFDNWAVGIHAFATAPNQALNAISLLENTAFDSGTIGGAVGADILLGGSGVPAVSGVVTGNLTYRVDRAETAALGWYFSSANTDFACTNNYFVGTMEVDDWTTATVTGNTVYSTTLAVVFASGQVLTRGSLSGQSWSGNTWYGTASALRWSHQVAGGPQGAIPQMTYAQWLTAVQAQNPTGFAAPGTFVNGAPPNTVVVRPNVYEAGRAHVTIYNWDGLSSVAVNLAGAVSVGASYAIRHVFDVFGTPLVTGTYDGGTVAIPMTAVAPPTPLARTGSHVGPTPGPTFGAFLVTAT